MAAISKITKTSYSGSRAAYYGIPPGMGIQKKNIINWKAAERRSTDDNFHHSHWMQESSAQMKIKQAMGFQFQRKSPCILSTVRGIFEQVWIRGTRM